MGYRIQVTQPAKADAKAFAAYIVEKHKSLEAAGKWLDGLYWAINDLAENPYRFPEIAEAEQLGSTYRSFNFHSHRVVYLVEESKQLVIIHRVYHCARKPLTDEDIL